MHHALVLVAARQATLTFDPITVTNWVMVLTLVIGVAVFVYRTEPEPCGWGKPLTVGLSAGLLYVELVALGGAGLHISLG